ncbi:hypothetical protein LTR70_002999 [Exophiala xenobiotica]|uniref:Uncharacterized protein n=1 Tax=Lithohypha guttulata TaxID=1690604 RepID=A0ABR0K884_9EURO|nr:hypothetical protein LTR24_005679 [Lithohypha guttulata]KAK5324369.1 hypothetical protein LTR70_002999 [Exophiala xenobiotica]
MDVEVNPTNVAHTPPPLGSDQLNYLIWRYLQEAGYAEAAVKLQRDWKVDFGTLPFAKHIKGRALVNLVQKGLRYHHLSLTFDENGQQTKTLVPSMFFFGPESAPADGVPLQKETLLKGNDLTRGVSPASTVATAPRLKPREATEVAPDELTPQTAKRGRKSTHSLAPDRNGITARKVSGATEPDATNGNAHQQPDVTSPPTANEAADDGPMTNGNHDDKMDLDHEARAESVDIVMEEQSEEPPTPLVPTLTNGVSVEVQVAPAKVTNLAPTSAILSLDSPQPIRGASWRPEGAETLVAQSDTYCGSWNLAGQSLLLDSVKPLPKSLFPRDDVGLVTTIAWNAEGSMLAVATWSEEESHIHLFEGQDLILMETLPASQKAVTLLKWHHSGCRLVGIAPSEDNTMTGNGVPTSTLLSWNVSLGSGPSGPSTLSLPTAVLDFDCAGGAEISEVYAAGEDAIYRCQGLDKMRINQHWNSPGVHAKEEWTFIRCAQLHNGDNTIITAASETATIWLPEHGLLEENVHAAPVTGLEVRPRGHPVNGSHRIFEFATSSEDGTIKIWQLTNNENVQLSCRHQLRSEPFIPIMSLSYSADGFCLAGASYNTARIWNAQHSYNLMASWEGSEPEWKGSSIRDDDQASAAGRSSINGEGGPLSAHHTLDWHSDGKKLAFGLGSHVVVINLQR